MPLEYRTQGDVERFSKIIVADSGDRERQGKECGAPVVREGDETRQCFCCVVPAYSQKLKS